MIALLRNLWTHRGDLRRPTGYERRHGGTDAAVEVREIVAARRAALTATEPPVELTPNDGAGAVEGWSPAAEVAGAVTAPELARTPEEREVLEIAATRAEWAPVLNPVEAALSAGLAAVVDRALARLRVTAVEVHRYAEQARARAVDAEAERLVEEAGHDLETARERWVSAILGDTRELPILALAVAS